MRMESLAETDQSGIYSERRAPMSKEGLDRRTGGEREKTHIGHRGVLPERNDGVAQDRSREKIGVP